MINKDLNKYANKLVNAFLKNKIISPIPSNYTKKFLKLKNLENFVKVKLKNLLQDLKQLAQEFLFKKIKRKRTFLCYSL